MTRHSMTTPYHPLVSRSARALLSTLLLLLVACGSTSGPEPGNMSTSQLSAPLPVALGAVVVTSSNLVVEVIVDQGTPDEKRFDLTDLSVSGGRFSGNVPAEFSPGAHTFTLVYYIKDDLFGKVRVGTTSSVQATVVVGEAIPVAFSDISTDLDGDGDHGTNLEELGNRTDPTKPQPQHVSATGLNAAVRLTWDTVPGATSYNIYWSITSGVTTSNGTRITNATSSDPQTGFTNNTTYYFVVTAVLTSGETSASMEVMATPQAASPIVPQNVSATAGDGTVRIQWDAVAGASSYTIYMAAAPGVTKTSTTGSHAGFMKHTDVTSPFDHPGLTNGTAYSFVVTAFVSGAEGPESAEVSAIPTASTGGGDTTPPTVAFTSPANGATGAAINVVITAIFSEAMATSTLNATTFTLSSASGPVSGTVTPGGITASFVPSVPLAEATTYTATITTAAQDAAGNALGANYTWSFTTLPATRILTVTRLGAGSGTVTSGPIGINCGPTCTASFDSGTVVTLDRGTPPTGSAFTGWGGACTGTGLTCLVTMDAAKTVTATFTLQHILTVTKPGTGSGTVTSGPIGINCGPTCTASFDSGTVVTLDRGTPPTGSTFTGWGGACTGTGLTCLVRMDAPKFVTATFMIHQPTVTSVSPSLVTYGVSTSQSVAISGTNFVQGATITVVGFWGSLSGVTVAGSSATAATPFVYVNSGQLRFWWDNTSLPISTYTVTVTHPQASGGLSGNLLGFTVTDGPS